MIIVALFCDRLCHRLVGWIFTRRLQQTTKLGAFLDPVADKLIVAAALISAGKALLHYLTIPAMVIIGREIVVSALREWMASVGQRAHVAVVTIAKWKTLSQMLGFLPIGLYPTASPIIVIIGYIAL